MLVLASAPPEERMSDTTAPTGTADDVVAAALTLLRDRGAAAAFRQLRPLIAHVMTTG